jgi:hypothetical protein
MSCSSDVDCVWWMDDETDVDADGCADGSFGNDDDFGGVEVDGGDYDGGLSIVSHSSAVSPVWKYYLKS